MPGINKIIDDTFTLEKPLGSGAAGEVFRARLLRDWQGLKSGHLVAIKFYKDEILKREREDIVFARRIREAQIGSTLRHENLVQCLKASEFWRNGVPRYLVMEYVDGTPLDRWARDKTPLPTNLITSIGLGIAKGLAELHQNKLIHRDVKPPNILITQDERPVLLDLGVVKPLDTESLTGSQVFLGTLRYASPELLFAEEYSYATDVYSLGAVLLFLVSGQEIFGSRTLFSQLVIDVRDEVPELDDRNRDPVKAYLTDLIMQALSKSPGRRPTLEDFVEFLSNPLDGNVTQHLRLNRLNRLLGLGAVTRESTLRERILQEVPRSELDNALALYDIGGLFVFQPLRAEVLANTLRLDASFYSSLPVDERITWIEEAFKTIQKDKERTLGTRIEAAHLLAEQVFETERSEKVLTKLKPTLDDAESAWYELLEDLKQENP